eukprot:COSAG02_NODE_561_length_20308_cov_42.799495_3_plen_73_part_00
MLAEHLLPTVTKRTQGILCNPLVPKLAELVPNDRRVGAKVYLLGTKVGRLAPNDGRWSDYLVVVPSAVNGPN